MEKDKLIAGLIVGALVIVVVLIVIGLLIFYKSSSGQNTKNKCPVVPYPQSGITVNSTVVGAGGSAVPGKPLTQEDSVGWYLINNSTLPIRLIQQYYAPNSQQPTTAMVPTVATGGDVVSYLNKTNQSYPLFPSMTFYISGNDTNSLTVPANINPSTDVVVITYEQTLSASVCNSNGSTPINS